MAPRKKVATPEPEATPAESSPRRSVTIATDENGVGSATVPEIGFDLVVAEHPNGIVWVEGSLIRVAGCDPDGSVVVTYRAA